MASSTAPIPEKPQSALEATPDVASDAPLYSREKILGMNQTELADLQTKLQEGDSTVQEEYRIQIADGTFAELKDLSQQMDASSGTPEKLAALREEADSFSRKLMDDLTSSSRTPEELTAVLAGYRLEKEQATMRANVLNEFSTDKVKVFKERVLSPSGPLALLGTAGVLSFTASEMATLQGAETEEDFNQSLREFTKSKTEKYFGTPTELDSDDLVLLASEVQNQHEKAQKEKPGLIDKIPFAEQMNQAASAAKSLIYFNVVRKASTEMSISKGVLLRVGTKTVGELNQMLASFDLNDPNLDPKIAEMAKLRDEIDTRRNELEDVLRIAIRNFHQDGFTEEARERMAANLTVDNMSIMSILSYWYMDHNERENWFTHCVSRISTMKRAWKHWVTRRDLTVGRFGGLFEPRSVTEWRNASISHTFVENFDPQGKRSIPVLDAEMEKLSHEVKGLSEKIETSVEQNDTKSLRKTEAHDVKVNVQDADGKVTGEKSVKVNEHGEGLIQRRDAAVQRYNELGKKYSAKFGEMATDLIQEGKQLDELAASGNKPTNFDAMKAEYNKRFALFAEAKEAYDGRFAAMGSEINAHAQRLGQFEKGTAMAMSKGTQAEQTHRAVLEGNRSNFMAGRAVRTAKIVALPGLVIGSEVYAALRGEAKWGEVGYDLAEAGAGFVPVVGTALDFKSAFTGKSLSGRQLSTGERWASFGFGCIGVVADVGTLLGGIGYGLRAGVAAGRGARVAKTVANGGKFNSLVFRAGQKIGGAASVFRQSGRVRALESAEEAVSLTRTANRIHELRRLDKVGAGLDAARKTELAGLEVSKSSELLEQLSRNRFYRKGSEFWFTLKGKVYKKTLPKGSVDAVDKVQGDLKVAEKALGEAQVAAQKLAGSGAFKREDVFKKLESFAAGTPEHAALEALKAAENGRDAFRYAKKAHEAQLLVEQERAVKSLHKIDVFTGYASKMGMGSAALLMLTGGHVGPLDVAEGAYNVAKPVAHVAGKVTNELFLEEHKVNNSVENFVEDQASEYVTESSSVEEQFAGAIAQGERREYIDHQARKGVSSDQVLRDHADDPGFREIAYQEGKSDLLT